jgi:hypothetical protein
MCKYSQFGHTVFTVRLASLSEAEAQAGQPFPSAQRLTIGINSQGLTVFEPQSKTARETFTYNGEPQQTTPTPRLFLLFGLSG